MTDLATTNGADLDQPGDPAQFPQDAPDWARAVWAAQQQQIGFLMAQSDRLATIEGHVALLVDFAGSVAEQLAQAKPVVDAIAKGGIGGVLGLLKRG